MKKRLFIAMLLLSQNVLSAEKTVKISAYERRPYVANDRAEKGYLYDVAIEVFEAEGYKVEIKFLPLARAQAAVKDGESDILMPAYKIAPSDFLYSDALPGDSVGFLAVKDKQAIKADPSQAFSQQLNLLSGKNIAMVRGVETGTAFDKDSSIKKSLADRVVQNIDKLVAGRVDLVLVDKYEAADILVNERPNLIGQLEFIKPTLIENSFHLASGKKNPRASEFLEAFNRGLAKIKAKGRLQEILLRYGFSEQKNDTKTLNIISVDNGDMKVMQELSKTWELANPGVKLNWVVLSENNLRQRIYASLAISDQIFDVMTIGAFDTGIYAKKGWLSPFENMSTGYDIDDLLSGIRSSLSYEKKIYALPFYGESSMTFYRKDVFQKAGLQMPEKPTYQQIKGFAAKLHNPKDKFYGICLRGKAGWGENMALVTTMVNTFGGAWFDGKWTPLLSSTSWATAVGTYLDLLNQFGPPSAADNGFGENLKLFAEGHCAMWVDATVAAGMLFDKKSSEVADKVGFSPAPIGTVDKGSHWVWTWALGVPSTSSRKALAQSFISWATSKEYIKLVGETKGWVALPPGTRRSTYTNQNYRAAAPFAPLVLDLIEKADPKNATAVEKKYEGIQFVNIPEFPAIGAMVGFTINKALRGSVSPGEALSQSQIEVEKIMRKSGYF